MNALQIPTFLQGPILCAHFPLFDCLLGWCSGFDFSTCHGKASLGHSGKKEAYHGLDIEMIHYRTRSLIFEMWWRWVRLFSDFSSAPRCFTTETLSPFVALNEASIVTSTWRRCQCLDFTFTTQIYPARIDCTDFDNEGGGGKLPQSLSLTDIGQTASEKVSSVSAQVRMTTRKVVSVIRLTQWWSHDQKGDQLIWRIDGVCHLEIAEKGFPPHFKRAWKKLHNCWNHKKITQCILECKTPYWYHVVSAIT